MAFVVNGGRALIEAAGRTHPHYQGRGISSMTSRYMVTTCRQLYPDLDLSEGLYTSMHWRILEPVFEADPTQLICRKVPVNNYSGSLTLTENMYDYQDIFRYSFLYKCPS